MQNIIWFYRKNYHKYSSTVISKLFQKSRTKASYKSFLTKKIRKCMHDDAKTIKTDMYLIIEP